MGLSVEIYKGGLPKRNGISELWVEEVIEKIAQEVAIPEGKLSIALVTKPTIREMNRVYRGKDRPTDVLAFPYEREARVHLQEEYWGEIVISPAMARLNIPHFGLPFKQELARLLIHGTLHLVGYDHVKKNDAKIMFGLTDTILKKMHI